MYGIPEKLSSRLCELANKHGAGKLVLFGSRARGSASDRSDIDLAAYGVPASLRSRMRLETDELPTLLAVDLIFIDDDTDANLLQEINRDGVTIYESDRQNG